MVTQLEPIEEPVQLKARDPICLISVLLRLWSSCNIDSADPDNNNYSDTNSDDFSIQLGGPMHNQLRWPMKFSADTQKQLILIGRRR